MALNCIDCSAVMYALDVSKKILLTKCRPLPGSPKRAENTIQQRLGPEDPVIQRPTLGWT